MTAPNTGEAPKRNGPIGMNAPAAKKRKLDPAAVHGETDHLGGLSKTSRRQGCLRVQADRLFQRQRENSALALSAPPSPQPRTR